MAAKSQKDLVESALALGDERLPHEILLSVAQGKPLDVLIERNVLYERGAKMGQIKSIEVFPCKHYPSAKERISAAREAAPYYAPKLASKELRVDADVNVSGVMEVPVVESQEDWFKAAEQSQQELKKTASDR